MGQVKLIKLFGKRNGQFVKKNNITILNSGSDKMYEIKLPFILTTIMYVPHFE